jgi:hypothetical protein
MHAGIELVHELLVLEQVLSIGISACMNVICQGSKVNVDSVRVCAGPGRVRY